LRRARFTFRPAAAGVVITLPVRAGDQLAYSVFAREPQLSAGAVLDGGVRTTLSLPATSSPDPAPFTSASDRRLTRVTLTAVAEASGVAAVVIRSVARDR
jgi:hypothetical protein